MSLYTHLGVKEDADAEEIIRGFREKAKGCHPDLHGEEGRAEFDRITFARDVLTDPARRAHYDETGDAIGLQPDNGSVPLATALSGAFLQVMASLDKEGLDPAGGDMAAAMRSVLMNERREVLGNEPAALARIQRLRRALGRFEEGEGGLLESIVRSQVEGAEQAVRIARSRLPAIDEGLTYLAKCRYRSGP